MNRVQFVLTVLLLALGTQITRSAPFVLFGNEKKLPPVVEYLGKVLPASMMGLLVVYCFKDYTLTNVMPAVLAAVLTALVHLTKKNTILSISLGTLLYMVLVRII